MGEVMIKLCNVMTQIEADRIIALLESNDIVCYRMESGAGSYLNITTGMSLSGYDIYVEKRRIEEAKKLLEEI